MADVKPASTSTSHGSREIAEALGFEPDNHHNALACPYCTGNGFWIATNTRQAGGRRVLGPFVSRDLALEVRTFVEQSPKALRHGTTYWVVTGDEVPDV